MIYVQCSLCFKLSPKEWGACSCGQPFQSSGTADAGSSAPAIHVFRSGWFEHIAADPIYIKTKRQLKHETEDRGLTSHYVH